jgi:hypothetical protein
MKKQQIIIALSVVLFFILVYFMGRDLFTGGSVSQENPAEYNIDKYRMVDSSKICYHEIKQIPIPLEQLNGLTVDDSSRLYVTADQKVLFFDSQWVRKGGFKLDTTANCISLSTKNTLLLGIGAEICEYAMDGKQIRQFEPLNSEGYITSIVQIGENIFAADAGNKIVLKYDDQGKLLQEIGRKDSTKGISGFILPSLYFDLAKGPGEDLWVSNPGLHLLQNFDENGKLNTSWGEATIRLEGFAGCCNPVDFAILPDGSFVTYEKGMDRIKIYNRAGMFDCVVSAPTNIDEAALTNCSIGAKVHDLAADAAGNIFVLDDGAKMIRVYQKKQIENGR